MPKVREIIYLNATLKERCIISYRIEFHEFIASLVSPLHNLLILEGDYWGEDYHGNTRWEFVRQENLPDLISKDVYSYGDFCWVDFGESHALDVLEPQEVAELLYLGHLMKPFHSPFFPTLRNRFAYLAHDDGWFNKLYCQDMHEFTQMVGRLFPLKIKTILKSRLRTSLPALPDSLSSQLFALATDGIVVNIDRLFKKRGTIEIPFHVIGKFVDMDEMYNKLDRHIGRSQYAGWLVYTKSGWRLREEQE